MRHGCGLILHVILFFLVSLILFFPPSTVMAAENYNFNTEEFEPKNFEWGGYAEIKWEHIDLNSNRIMVKDSKGGKSRAVYFKGSLKKVLKKYQKCFGFYKGAVIRGKCRRRITRASLQNLIRRVFVEAKIDRKGLSIHSLRHYYADRLRRKKVDLQTISILLGHSRIDTTEIYLHVSEEDLKKAAIV